MAFNHNKRELYHNIQQETKTLEEEFYGLAPINILVIKLEENFTKNEILNGINDLIKNNIIKQTDDKQYLRSCY